MKSYFVKWQRRLNQREIGEPEHLNWDQIRSKLRNTAFKMMPLIYSREEMCRHCRRHLWDRKHKLDLANDQTVSYHHFTKMSKRSTFTETRSSAEQLDVRSISTSKVSTNLIQMHPNLIVKSQRLIKCSKRWKLKIEVPLLIRSIRWDCKCTTNIASQKRC